jgi:hypothetical protein
MIEYHKNSVQLIEGTIVFEYSSENSTSCYGSEIKLPVGFYHFECWGASGEGIYLSATSYSFPGGLRGYSMKIETHQYISRLDKVIF